MSASPEFHIDEKNKSRFMPVARSVSDQDFSEATSQLVASPHNLTLSNRQASSVSGFLHSERRLEPGQGLAALAIG
jgi:hypothetical protein